MRIMVLQKKTKTKKTYSFTKKKKEKKGNIPNYYYPCRSPSNTALYGSKVVLFMSCFHVTVQLTKKEEENSNPGHFALAVTDKF